VQNIIDNLKAEGARSAQGQHRLHIETRLPRVIDKKADVVRACAPQVPREQAALCNIFDNIVLLCRLMSSRPIGGKHS
jgi:hypothetical protein